jgi:predicted DNA-binding WGR domain protein
MATKKINAIHLLLGLAGVPKGASEIYSQALVTIGVDTKAKFNKLGEQEMKNCGMKKGHVRAVTRTITSAQTSKRKASGGGNSSTAGGSKRAKGDSKNYLSGAVICISGTMSTSRAKLTAAIKAAGGSVASSVTKNCTHLLTSTADVLAETSKVGKAVDMDVPLCEEGFLGACEQAGTLVDHAKYVINSAKASESGDDKDDAESEVGIDGPAPHPRSVQYCPSAKVLQTTDEDGEAVVFDADLNQQELAQNVDKFYLLQVLTNGASGQYWLFQHYGRTGTAGQVSTKDYDKEVRSANHSRLFYIVEVVSSRAYTFISARLPMARRRPQQLLRRNSRRSLGTSGRAGGSSSRRRGNTTT